MNIKSLFYKLLKYSNDASAVERSMRTRSGRPIIRRIARRAYGKLTGRLARKLFG